MKLKEPLQGLKLIPKHVVSHLAFFLISLQIRPDELVDTTIHKDYPSRIYIFQLLQTCHAVSVVIFLINVYSKVEKNEFCLKFF
jgi:Na+/H+ antiporter NhaA